MARRAGQPLVSKLRDRIAADILDARFRDGDMLPSVRTLAAETGANPLTVAKAYRVFIDSGVVRMRRGVGLFVAEGGARRLHIHEKTGFLSDEWPQIRAEIRRLGLNETKLVLEALQKRER